MIDFSLSPKAQDLKDRTDAFVAEKIIPFESDPRFLDCPTGVTEDLRLELVALARDAGLLTPHLPEEWGGVGLSHTERAAVFEASGYSPLGPIAMHIGAPDEGNMHLIEAVGSDEQKNTYLPRLASGELRSCFAMTEPAPGAGSDPTMLTTTAVKDGNHWVINGHKWMISSAQGSGLAIIMARTADKIVKGKGASMFLVETDMPGFNEVRRIETMDAGFVGGHSELKFENLRVTADHILGELDEGYRYAQVRLVPARLTHCMRWLGAARRCNEIASAYVKNREAFGKRLADHEGIGFMIADNEIEILASRLMTLQACWALDQGDDARQESSMAKVFCAEAIFRIVDRSLQALGGSGAMRENLVERIFRDTRLFRIYDGPSEVHRWAIARRKLA